VLNVILANTVLKGNKDEIIRVHGLMETALAAENKNLKKFIGDYVKYTAIQDDNVLLSKNNQLKTTYLLAAIAFLVIIFVVLMIVWLNKEKG